MAVALTYHVRRGLLSVVGSRFSFELPTHREAARVQAWETVYEFRPGKYVLWDHCFEVPQKQLDPAGRGSTGLQPETVTWRLGQSTARKLEIYDFPGDYAQRYDGVSPGRSTPHMHSGSALYVGDRRRGIYIHRWPPCNLKLCVVVMRQWDDVVRAIAREKILSFAIAY